MKPHTGFLVRPEMDLPSYHMIKPAGFPSIMSSLLTRECSFRGAEVPGFLS